MYLQLLEIQPDHLLAWMRLLMLRFIIAMMKEELQSIVSQKGVHLEAIISKILLSCLKESSKLLRLTICNPDQK